MAGNWPLEPNVCNERLADVGYRWPWGSPCHSHHGECGDGVLVWGPRSIGLEACDPHLWCPFLFVFFSLELPGAVVAYAVSGSCERPFVRWIISPTLCPFRAAAAAGDYIYFYIPRAEKRIKIIAVVISCSYEPICFCPSYMEVAGLANWLSILKGVA